MSLDTKTKSLTIFAVYVAAILGTMLIMAVLVLVVRQYMRPTPLNASRIEERRKALADVTAQGKDQLESYGWVDQGKGLVRLPISQAMELVIKGGQDPAAARSNLLARVERANPPPPPKPPDKPSPFE
jgi:hypothetical protein